MKRLIAALGLTLLLAGCSTEIANIKAAYSVITQATVSPQVILVTANAFDALEAGAAQYLVYCKSNLSNIVCSASNRRSVITAGRSGRAARNQLEPYITSGTAGPKALYDTLSAAVSDLRSSQASGFGVTTQ
jgi:Prokaryotic membrane lipoprotein lipid attachment site